MPNKLALKLNKGSWTFLSLIVEKSNSKFVVVYIESAAISMLYSLFEKHKNIHMLSWNSHLLKPNVCIKLDSFWEKVSFTTQQKESINQPRIF